MRPKAIDPVGCGCTECLVGEYVPLDRADTGDLIGMFLGKVANNTSMPTDAAITWGRLNNLWENRG